MTYFDWCCHGWCVDKYDDLGEMVCPCVPHDGRDCIANCCYALLVIGLILGIIVCVPLVLIRGLVVVHGVSVTVEDASLATFNLATPTTASTPTTTTTAAVTYNISMTVRVHNPNWILGVDFAAPLKARYSFDGALFGHAWLAGEGEKLPAGKTQVYHLATGAVDESVPLGVDGVADFARQSSAGVFEVDVVVAGHYTLRGAKRSLAATCPLKLPLGAQPAASEKVKCV